MTVIFKSRDKAEKFHIRLNSKHKNIKFCIEHENEYPFLDIFIEGEGSQFLTFFQKIIIQWSQFSSKCFKI